MTPKVNARAVLDASSEWWEKCARHKSPQTSRMFQYAYLCDSCAERVCDEALNGRPFVYHGETVLGFCGVCNETGAVTLRQAFACTMCWNVVLSFQKSLVASRAVHDAWENSVAPRLPSLILEETEEMRLEPYVRGSGTKQKLAETLEVLDFRVLSRAESGVTPVCHVELKSGPGSIDEMSEFQLDVNDYEDIVGASCYTGLPSYVIHVQLQQLYKPPTRGTLAKGVWWTDVFRLRQGIRTIKQRRGEDKDAVYFEPRVFQSIETFADELLASGYTRLREQLDRAALALPARPARKRVRG